MPDLEITFDLARIDFRRTSDLIGSSYWGEGRSDEMNRRAFANSLCGAAFIDGEQVAFARAITDRCAFAYLADVIVWPEHRGKGIGQRLIRAFLDHPELGLVGHWSLRTRDAHELYAKFGFVRDGSYMRLARD
jgi:GNAT superfamily N-acetyltransferase